MTALRECLVMAKPVGPRCNLRCAYCYYLGKEALFPAEAPRRMSDALLERYVRSYLEASPGPVTHFEWHGGEPTLAGVEFFRRAVELQRRHRPPGRVVSNGLQTNGTLLDETWAAFLAGEGFSVGLSLDGPADLHDTHRVTAGGAPTHAGVVRAFELLRRRRVETHLLCVLHATNAAHPDRVYRFFRELGAARLQLLPLVEPRPGAPRGVSDRTAPPELLGDFLCRTFDRWLAADVGRVVVQTFDEALRWACGLPHALCTSRETCGDVVVVEHDGAVYACDHFVDPAHRLGDVAQGELAAALDSAPLQAFGRAKSDLPRACRTCDVLAWCNGGCPKDRIATAPDGEPGLSYLCPAYRRFFRHAGPQLRRLAARWRAGQRLDGADPVRAPRREARTGPNEPCPCGSGRKFKRCCRN